MRDQPGEGAAAQRIPARGAARLCARQLWGRLRGAARRAALPPGGRSAGSAPLRRPQPMLGCLGTGAAPCQRTCMHAARAASPLLAASPGRALQLLRACVRMANALWPSLCRIPPLLLLQALNRDALLRVRGDILAGETKARRSFLLLACRAFVNCASLPALILGSLPPAHDKAPSMKAGPGWVGGPTRLALRQSRPA